MSAVSPKESKRTAQEGMQKDIIEIIVPNKVVPSWAKGGYGRGLDRRGGCRQK